MFERKKFDPTPKKTPFLTVTPHYLRPGLCVIQRVILIITHPTSRTLRYVTLLKQFSIWSGLSSLHVNTGGLKNYYSSKNIFHFRKKNLTTSLRAIVLGNPWLCSNLSIVLIFTLKLEISKFQTWFYYFWKLSTSNSKFCN